MAPLPNRILGDRYRLLRPLDTGGMGSVWLAEHLSLASPVAVKLIAPSATRTPARLERFVREARAAAASRSPHVVQVLDHGVDDGLPFIVMELLEGESLAERLARLGRLSAAQTELVVRHVSRALARAHETGIVHRDLKPANIFITRNDDEEIIKLFDFGIAKATPALAPSLGNHTRTGSLLGTPYYMSPEQLEASRRCDHRTDIWALGVIAYECLLGQLPFAGGGIGGLVLAVCTNPLPVPSQQGSVPSGFDAWFARACARSLDQRFQSARDAALDLRRLIEPGFEPPVAAVSEPLAQEPQREQRLPLSLPTTAAATTAAASGTTLDGIWRLPPARTLSLLAPVVGGVTLALGLYAARAPSPLDAAGLPAPGAASAPAAELPAPPALAALEVAGTPDQTLSLDGKPLGRLPLALHDVEPGNHTLTISGGPRYHAYQQPLQLEPGQRARLGPVLLDVDTVLVTLVAGNGAEDAELSLRVGDSEAPLPALPLQLEIDTDKQHTLLARRKGYAPYSQRLSFEDGQAERTIAVDLAELPEPRKRRGGNGTSKRRPRRPRAPSTQGAARPAPAALPTLSFEATPAAAVLLDGAPLGTTPLHEVPVRPGSHRVIFIHGTQRKAVLVVSTPGKSKTVSAAFRTPRGR